MKKLFAGIILALLVTTTAHAFDPPVRGETRSVIYGKFVTGITDNETAIGTKVTTGAEAEVAGMTVLGTDGENAIFFGPQSVQPSIVGKTGFYRLGDALYKVENGIASPIGSGSAADAYTKTETDNLLVLKANQATTYTKDEVNALIDAALGFPLVSIIAPTDNQWVTESPYTGFNGTSSDTGSVSAMEWKLEAGGTYVATTGTTTWSVASVPVTQGENILYARATDDQSNETEKTVTFNVDSIAPVVVADADSTHDGATPVVGGMMLTEVNPGVMTASVVGATPTTTPLTGTYPNYVTGSLTPDGVGDITVTFDGVADLAGNVATTTDLVEVFTYYVPTSCTGFYTPTSPVTANIDFGQYYPHWGAVFTPSQQRNICKVAVNLDLGGGDISGKSYFAEVHEFDVDNTLTSVVATSSAVTGNNEWNKTVVEFEFDVPVTIDSAKVICIRSDGLDSVNFANIGLYTGAEAPLSMYGRWETGLELKSFSSSNSIWMKLYE